MSRAATEDMKAARRAAHRAFDGLWMTGRCTRMEAYLWLGKVMQKKKRAAHIASFTVAECEHVVVECRRYKRPGDL